ncbi:alpha-galactosidase [Planomonospora sp. ID82291]|uniref:alpha-galactosidase n=1 Tax=Planomonospora sp. ID82291 TaxID=2738136 RepID=UPI0018C3C114|nr:alpha-galactosidase [Planomonospora sp. ID82291]MBG0818866.1 alpha-galactosidase [Planomonospora sp. ID82291]
MSRVTHLAEHRLWLLTTPATSYALRLDDEDRPRHVHWGARLTAEQAATVPPPVSRDAGSFQTGGPGGELEGPGFGPPSLDVRFADGGAGVEWRYRGHAIDGGDLAVRFADRHHPLEITLHYRVHDDTDVIERWTVLRHTGDGDSRDPVGLLRWDSAAWTLPPLPAPRLSHVAGGWAAETLLRREALPYGETVLTSRRGTTGHQANPWVMLDGGQATEEHGEVWSAALAWSGSWRITVHRPAFDAVGLTGGSGHDGLSWRLAPGETWRSPVFAGVYGAAGFGGISRQWHSYALRHVLPHPDELRPVVYDSWEATGFDVDLAGQLRLVERAAALGAELYVLDDGWFGARRSQRAGLGDWRVARDRFPGGLDPLIEAVRARGMRFGLWVEPEMVNPDSDLYRERPDWVLHLPNRRRTTLRDQLVLDFARPEVAGWAYDWLDRLLTGHRIDFLKWDFNRPLTEVGRPGHDDPGRLWTDHVRSVYAVIDRLRAAHPHLRIETCAGGGGRVDFGILARTDEAWASDNTDAVDRIGIQHGYGQVYPARTMAAWVTDSPNPLTGRAVPLRFRFHVAMSGVLGLGGDLTRWSAAELAEAAGLVALYKEVRPAVQHGALHRLTRADAPVTAVQYVLGDAAGAADEVVVLAWRVTARFGHTAAPLRLAALDPGAVYRDTGTGAAHHGAVLLAHGLPLDLPPGDHASGLTRLVRLPAGAPHGPPSPVPGGRVGTSEA